MERPSKLECGQVWKSGETFYITHKSKTGLKWRMLSLRNFVALEYTQDSPSNYWVYCGKLGGEELNESLLNEEFA